MPYKWTHSASSDTPELHLWPHQSLQPQGYTRFLGITAALISIPLLALLGSALLWALLPFVLLALFGMKWALDRSRSDRQILEILSLSAEQVHLLRINPDGQRQRWQCNRYWARAEMRDHGGPVPHYVTLSGSNREVEIGAFLSEEERIALFDELTSAIARH